MTFARDGGDARDELVPGDAQVMQQLPVAHVPDEQREGLLYGVPTHAHLAVGADEQTVEEAVLAHLERCHDVAVGVAHHVDAHPVARQRDHVLVVVDAEVRHLDAEHALQSRHHDAAVEVDHLEVSIAQHDRLDTVVHVDVTRPVESDELARRRARIHVPDGQMSGGGRNGQHVAGVVLQPEQSRRRLAWLVAGFCGRREQREDSVPGRRQQTVDIGVMTSRLSAHARRRRQVEVRAQVERILQEARATSAQPVGEEVQLGAGRVKPLRQRHVEQHLVQAAHAQFVAQPRGVEQAALEQRPAEAAAVQLERPFVRHAAGKRACAATFIRRIDDDGGEVFEHGA